jgi:replicative DNA helicase
MKENNAVEKLEKKLFGYMLENPKYTASALQLLTHEDLSQNQDVFHLIAKYYKKYKGTINTEVVKRLQETGNISVDLFSRWTMLKSELTNINIIDFADFNFVCEQIQLNSTKRTMFNVAEQIVNLQAKKNISDEERITEIENIKRYANTANVNKAQQTKIVNLYDDIKNIMNDMNSEAQTKDAVIPSGYNKIDKQSGGFRKGELVYVVGRKGDGKSVTLINFAHNAVVAGKNVIYFSLEMSALMCQRRYLSRATQIPMVKFKNGEVTMEEMSDFATLAKEKKQKSFNGKEWTVKENIGTFCVVESAFSMTTATVDSIIQAKEEEMGLLFDMVIVDYAGIMSASSETGGSERRHQQGQVALELKRLALQRNMVVVSAAQMNREGSKKKEAVSTANIAESDQIADHLDWGLAVYTSEENENEAVMTTIKVRDGEPFSTKMKKDYAKMTLTEYEDLMDEWDNY